MDTPSADASCGEMNTSSIWKPGHFIITLSCLLVKWEGHVSGGQIYSLFDTGHVRVGRGWEVAVNMGIHR